MIKLLSPCRSCTERCMSCHGNCFKYKAFYKINREVNRRIDEDIRKSSRTEYKPALQAICAKNKK